MGGCSVHTWLTVVLVLVALTILALTARIWRRSRRGTTAGISSIRTMLTAHCRPSTRQPMLLARFIAGYPLLTALLSAVSVCTLSSLSIVDECGGWQDFVVDTKLENYMKSDNYQTEMYDALGACILTQNELVAAHFGGLQTTAALAGPTALRRRLQHITPPLVSSRSSTSC